MSSIGAGGLQDRDLVLRRAAGSRAREQLAELDGIGVHGLQLLCFGRDGLGGYASSLDERAPSRQRRPSYASKSGGDQLPPDLDLDRDFTAVIRRGAFAVLFACGLASS